MEADDILVRLAQLELLQNIVPHAPRGAGREGCDGAIGKVAPQTAQLPVVRPEFMPPLRDTVRLVDGKKRDWDMLKPVDGVHTRQALRERYRRKSPCDARRITWACFSLGKELFSTPAGIPICASCAA